MPSHTHALLTLSLAGAIALTGIPALADTTTDQQLESSTSYPGGPTAEDIAELRDLQEQAISAADELEHAQARSDELDQRVKENESRMAELQAQLPELRQKASDALRKQYKQQSGGSGFIEILLSASSFDELVSLTKYYGSIQDYYLDRTNELVDAVCELDEIQSDLEAQRAEAKEAAESAQKASDEADEAIRAARAKASEKADAAREAYERAQAEAAEAAKAAEQKAQEEQAAAEAAPAAPTSVEAPAEPAPAPVASVPEPTIPESVHATAPADDSAYTWVVASMYELSVSIYDTTATGDLVTPTSMGVAMRTMPLGTVVELSYHGNTCLAVVNDRGPYVGNRQIDLQPAVAEALGFSEAVGVDTVGYRVVG